MYFKLDGYHKVNSINKKLGYRNTEALGDDDLSRSSLPNGSYVSVGAVRSHKAIPE